MKDAAKRLGLKQLPQSEGEAANGMTAVSDVPSFITVMYGLTLGSSCTSPKASRRVTYSLDLPNVMLLLLAASTLPSKVCPEFPNRFLFLPKHGWMYIDKYFRIGHMGVSVVDGQRGDINTITQALEETLKEARAAKSA